MLLVKWFIFSCVDFSSQVQITLHTRFTHAQPTFSTVLWTKKRTGCDIEPAVHTLVGFLGLRTAASVRETTKKMGSRVIY
jgi:hypothetical protein